MTTSRSALSAKRSIPSPGVSRLPKVGQTAAEVAKAEQRQQERDYRRTIDGRLDAVGKKVSTWWGPIVIWDFLLGCSIPFMGYDVIGGTPGSPFIAAWIAWVGLWRRPTVRVRYGGILLMVMSGLLVFLAVESQMNGMSWKQRDFKFLLILIAASVVASGRIHIRSFVIGGVVSALLNAVAFYGHLTPNEYPPYLTGFYEDKNVAGMYYAIWGVLGLMVMPKKWRLPWVFLSFALLYLTGSRTSLAALAAGYAWILVRNRTGVIVRLVLAGVGFIFLNWLINNVAENSAFGNRTGDDWYRHQIEMAMTAKTHVTPWYGLGLNQGFVVLGGIRHAFFHNSYQQAFVEGGWPFLLIILSAFLLFGLGLIDPRPVIPLNLIRMEGAVIVCLVCAWKLGEVFMTVGAFIVLGLCMAHRLGEPLRTRTSAGHVMRRAEIRNAKRAEENDAFLLGGENS